MSEAGGVAGECSHAFKEAFKRDSCALHVHAQILVQCTSSPLSTGL